MKMNNESIDQQLKYIYRKLNERTALSNLSNFANICEKLSNGNISIEIDSVNKIIKFGSGTNKLWMNVQNKTLNNVKSIVFQDSQINGLVSQDSIDDVKESPDDYANHAVSAQAFTNFIDEVDENYAAKEHKHTTSDIYRLNDNDEEETLDEIFDLYVPLSSVATTVQSNSLIPTNTAIITYCQDFLTVAGITNNQQLQTLLKGPAGKSAFEVWEEQQPIRYDQDGETIIPYTYNDFINSITGPVGYSAYEIWCSLQQPIGYDNDNNPLYPNEAYFLESLHGADGVDGSDGENFIDWYCRIREVDINSITWEDICEDIVQSATMTDEEGNETSIWDLIETITSVGEGAGLAGMESQIATLQGQTAELQAQIFTVQGAVGAILSSTVTDNSVEAFDQIVDNAESALNNVNGTQGSSVIESIGNLANRISSVFSRLRPTVNTAASTVNSSVLHSSLLGAGTVL